MSEENYAGNVSACPVCGRTLSLESFYVDGSGQSVFTCPACKTTGLAKVSYFAPEVEQFYANGMQQYRRGDYEEALICFDEAIKMAPNCYKAYWMRLLSANGVELVDEEERCKQVPTYSRLITQPIQSQQDYKKAYEYAPDNFKIKYENIAGSIESVRLKIEQQVDSIQPFDIFICFKETDVDSEGKDIQGSNTADYNDAQNIYMDLSRNYNVFFSPKTLQNCAGSEFETIIFKALSTAKVMILVGSKAEYVNARWVKNEWSRYMRFMEQGYEGKQPGTLIHVYKGKHPEGLPKSINTLQGINLAEYGNSQILLSNVERCIAKYPTGLVERDIIRGTRVQTGKKVAVSGLYRDRSISSSNIVIEPGETTRINGILEEIEDEDFGSAETECNVLLQSNPRLSSVRLYLLYALQGVKNAKELENKILTTDHCRKPGDLNKLVTELDAILTQSDTETAQIILRIIGNIYQNAIKKEITYLVIQTFRILAQFSTNENLNINFDSSVRNALVLYMQQLIKQGKDDEASNVFTQYSDFVSSIDVNDEDERSKKCAVCYFQYAQCYHNLGKFDRANQIYRQAIEYDPNNSMYYEHYFYSKNHLIGEGESENVDITQLTMEELENIFGYADKRTQSRLLKKFFNLALGQIKRFGKPNVTLSPVEMAEKETMLSENKVPYGEEN